MIKWTVKDAIEHLEQLKNPFEKTEIAQKPKLSAVIDQMAGGNGGEEVKNNAKNL